MHIVLIERKSSVRDIEFTQWYADRGRIKVYHWFGRVYELFNSMYAIFLGIRLKSESAILYVRRINYLAIQLRDRSPTERPNGIRVIISLLLSL